MRRFEARVKGRCFWTAVVVPPVLYFSAVAIAARWSGSAPMNPMLLMLLVAFAYALPLTALVWTLCSASAYTLRPGMLVVHRGWSDRVHALPRDLAPAWVGEGTVEFRLRERRIRLRVAEPLAFLVALRAAAVQGR